MSGDFTAAASAYEMASRYATNAAEKRYLSRQSQRLPRDQSGTDAAGQAGLGLQPGRL
jgi:hypothetical protein